MSLVRPLQKKTKGVKHWDCEYIPLYENVPARIGESRTIEENRLQDSVPHPRYGDDKADERKVMLCPNHPLTNFKAGDWLIIPWGQRPNNISPILGLSGLGPNIWINTPTGPELLTWTCQLDGTCSYQGVVEIYQSDDQWCMVYEGQEFCFNGFNFTCSEFPEGYSFVESTGPQVVYKVLKIDAKEDQLCRLAYYTVFIEFIDQEGVCIQ